MKKVLSIFKEIFLCICSLVKEIIRESVYVIRKALIFITMISIAFLLAFGIGSSFSFPTWLTITIGIIVLIVLFGLYAIIYGDFEKPFCKIPITAKKLDTMSIRMHMKVDVADPYYDIYVLILEYEYNNRTYKKKIEVNDGNLRVPGAKIDIMICKNFPKIMYILKNKK